MLNFFVGLMLVINVTFGEKPVLLPQNFVLLLLFSLFVALQHVLLKLLEALGVDVNIQHLGGLLKRARWKVQVHFDFVIELNAVYPRNHNRLRDLLAVGLVASVVLDLDVQVQTAFTSVKLQTVRVRAFQLALDFVSASAMVLLAARHVAFLRAAPQIFSVVVELLNQQYLLK